MNRLFYGDNLDVLRRYILPESVDLIYLDPPFNSRREYNVIFKERSGAVAASQQQAFLDSWDWPQAADTYAQVIDSGGKVAEALQALHVFLGPSDMLAYLVMMAPRLVELRRVLKSSGSIYLHCDPTASHYLKMLMDAVFGRDRFQNEIIWKRSHSHNSARRFGPVHDVLLFYSQGQTPVWNQTYQSYDEEYTKKHYRHVDSANGRRYKHENPTGAGIRHGQTGKPWRGIDPTAKGRHWVRPPDELERLDAAGGIYWPKKAGAWPYIKMYLDERLGMPAQDVWTDISVINMNRTGNLGGLFP